MMSQPPSRQTSPWLCHNVVIAGIRPEVTSVATYDLQFTDAAVAEQYRFAPGQFNMLYLPGAGEVAISISDDPASEGPIAHTIRVAGNVTGTLSNMQPGDCLGLRGPYGVGWPTPNAPECANKDVVLVAGGIGLAPLRPLIYSLLANRSSVGRVHLLYGARSPASLLYEKEYRAWSEQGLDIQVTVDGPDPADSERAEVWNGHIGVVTLLLERLPCDPENTVVVCCGPEIMMRYTAATATSLGIPKRRIWVSTERNMQCAVGFCGHCQLGPEFVCKDGPVFSYDRLEPYMSVEEL